MNLNYINVSCKPIGKLDGFHSHGLHLASIKLLKVQKCFHLNTDKSLELGGGQ